MAKHEYQLLYNFGKLVTCFIVYHSVPATIYGPPNDMIKWRTERYIRTGKVDILPCSLPIRIYIYIYIYGMSVKPSTINPYLENKTALET